MELVEQKDLNVNAANMSNLEIRVSQPQVSSHIQLIDAVVPIP